MADEIKATAVEETTETAKTYTLEEVQGMIEKGKKDALNQQKKKYEKELSLSKLDGEAREKAEKEQRIAELEEQLKEFQKLQTKSEVVKVLGERGLSPIFADLLTFGDTPEETQGNIEKLDKLIKSEVSRQVKSRLATGTPKASESKTNTITKE